MEDIIEDIEMASPSVIKQAGRDFATALAEMPQFKAFEQAYESLSQDATAQQALSAYRTKAESLRALLMLNAVDEPEHDELERLKKDYLTLPTVRAHAAAEAELTALCRQAAGMISEAIGLNYSASCGASCCG